ncbi:type VI secretion system lipoprotein TssJ [Shewanella marina]|uniref:type VI secretion system lipoprotein TssJ n=1 Tax=Shewanella marina TaxID=487319 RepID=UPI00047296DA|nr:type VI secretion system lipoprotein TssJ [Shewanella marina]
MNKLLIMLMLMSLSGCSLLGFDDEDLPPSTIAYSLYATDSVNPNVSGDGTPVEIQVFELEDDSMFQSAEYDQLVDDAEEALKSNYLDHRDYMLVPGQFKVVAPFELDDDTAYIGVMARFAEPDKSEWKKVVKVTPEDKQYSLLIHFSDKAVVLKKVE